MKHRYLYARMMYSMAYISAVSVVGFAYLKIPNDFLIAFALTCLVTGGYLSIGKDEPKQEPVQEEDLTSLDEEMEEARELEASENEA